MLKLARSLLNIHSATERTVEKTPGAAGKTQGNARQAQCQMLGQPLHLSPLTAGAEALQVTHIRTRDITQRAR
jgi:hypothetical protein